MRAARPIDVSWPVGPSTPVFPGDSGPERSWDAHPSQGDVDEVSRWVLGAHTGTHVDAPRHFLPAGGDLEGLGLDPFVGPARVVDVGEEPRAIDAGCLREHRLAGAERVLFRTRNSAAGLSAKEFDPGYVALTGDGAEYLVEAGVRTVGIDYLSIDCFPADEGFDFPAHHALLGAGVAVIEGLDLGAVSGGDYFLCALPLRLADSEAAPARAVLFPQTDP